MKLLNESNISKLLSNIDNILFDCDGVLWGGDGSRKVFNNASALIDKLQKLGKQVFLVTNNSTRTRLSFMELCKSFGINIDKESAICAPYVMAQYLKGIKFDKKVYVIGTQGLADELKSWNFDCVGPSPEKGHGTMYEMVANGALNLDPEVGAVAVGLDADFNYAKLVKANCYLSNKNCLLLANNIDERYPVLNTNYMLPAGGVMVRAVESASGRKATVIGKPSHLMFDILASKHGLKAERTLMVGDTLQTDIEFGNTCGMYTLLVLTGVSSKEEVNEITSYKQTQETVKLIPNFYIPSVGDLFNLIE